MATHKSAAKRHRQSVKRNARNTAVKSAVKTAIKKAREAIASGDPAKVKEAQRAAVRALDKAKSQGVLHARNAQRRIARLMKPRAAAK